MNGTRFSGRLLAVLMLAAALFSFGRLLALWGDASSSTLRLAIYLVAGIACILGAWGFWTGGGASRSSSRQAGGTPLFGRDAGVSGSGSRWRRVVVVLPFIAILALAADHFGPWRTQEPGVGESVAGEGGGAEALPAEPPQEELEEVADQPQPVPPAEEEGAGNAAVEEPAPEEDAAGAEEQPPEVAAEPEQVPPQTVAPLPPPVVQPTQPDGHRQTVVWLSVSPDGRSVMSASTDKAIKLWDIESGRLIRDVGVHKDMARAALFLPDGARALTTGDDGEIVLRSVEDGAVLHVFSATEHRAVRSVALSPDGRRAVTGHQIGTVIAWDIENRTVLHVLQGHDWPVNGVAISPDGTRAISGSIEGTLKLWDLDEGRLLRSWHGHERGTYGAAFMPDGRHAVTGSGDFTIKLWDLDTWQEVRRFEGHSGTVYALVLSDDGERILSGSLDGTARLWETATGRELLMLSPHSGTINSVAFAPGGVMLTGGGDRSIRVWPPEGGRAAAVFPGAPD